MQKNEWQIKYQPRMHTPQQTGREIPGNMTTVLVYMYVPSAVL